MTTAGFIDVSEEETNKMKEKAVDLKITRAIKLKRLSVHLRLSKYCRTIPGDCSTIFTEPEENNC